MIRIIIHIFPHELGEYKRIINQLNNSEVDISNSDIKLLCCLNLNKRVCRYENSTEIICNFNNINTNSKFSVESYVNTKTNFYGVNEHRRNCIKTSDMKDMIIYLDSDLHFNNTLLNQTLINADILSKQHSYYILTPECIRLWDSTWDCLVNKDFLKFPINYCETADIYMITKKVHTGDGIRKNKTFKWAGGWFTCINAPLAKLVSIPDSFVGYGPDDTFMMECCKLLKSKNIDVAQYIQSGQVVCEDRTLIHKNKPHFTHKTDFRKKCNQMFSKEYGFFKKRIEEDIYNINES
jgi:hypothetical protein